MRTIIAMLVVLACTAGAQVPRTISFQGVLADNQGNLVPDGNHTLKLVLYDLPVTGNQVYTETQTVPVVKGIFNAIIGSVSAIPASLAFDRAYYLGVSVDGGQELAPRTALTAVPYALRAERANVAESVAPNAAGVVTRINGVSGDLTMTGAGSTTVTSNGKQITISSSGTGGTGMQGVQNNDGTISIQNPNGPVATIGIADHALPPQKISPAGAISGQAIVYNGSDVQWQTVSGGGGGVTNLNGLTGPVTLAASGGATVSTAGSTITINAGSGGGTGIQGIQNTDNTLEIANPNGPTATINVKNQGITGAQLADGSVSGGKIASGQVVKSINALNDDVTLAAGNNVTITPSGNTLTIAAAGGGGTSYWTANGNNISNTNSGNIGIGTTNPTSKLEIAASDGLKITGTGAYMTLQDQSSGKSGYIQSIAGNLYLIPQSFHDLTSSAMVVQNTTGNVGIGTTTPSAKLDVSGSIRATNNASNDIIVETTGGTNAWAKLGVKSIAQKWSIGTSQNFNNNQLYFSDETNSTVSMCIMPASGNVGIGTGNPSSKLDVVSNYANGIHAFGPNLGMHSVGSSGGILAEGPYIGAQGTCTGSDPNRQGVRGDNGGSPTGYAGLFNGNTWVVGTLSKNAGAFRIDHPLDPANKFLIHSFVESPDMKNIYDGIVLTDANGDATVTLPNWFEALNMQFRYQLTVLGQFAQAIVSEEIASNRFSIKTDKPNVRVSWQVTGIRHDAYADARRIPVEEDKPADFRGKYIFPEGFGFDQSRSLVPPLQAEPRATESRTGPK